MDDFKIPKPIVILVTEVYHKQFSSSSYVVSWVPSYYQIRLYGS